MFTCILLILGKFFICFFFFYLIFPCNVYSHVKLVLACRVGTRSRVGTCTLSWYSSLLSLSCSSLFSLSSLSSLSLLSRLVSRLSSCLTSLVLSCLTSLVSSRLLSLSSLSLLSLSLSSHLSLSRLVSRLVSCTCTFGHIF